MEETKRIGLELKTIHNLIKRHFEAVRAVSPINSITRMQGWIIGYISEHDGKDVFQRDLEEAFSIRRSTATGILQLMEKNGLLIREPVKQDARLKKLVLTHKAREIYAAILQDMKQMEGTLRQGLTPEELSLFFNVLDKIKANLEQE